jgi:hypothetical protein
VNGGERAGTIENRELAGIAAVGFDAIARAARDKRRGNHVTRHVLHAEYALQVEATRAGFITALHWALAPQPFDEAQDRRTIRRERVKRRRPVRWP